MTRAMLLCAGKGTRLASLSSECPKPLLPVCNIPILRYGISHLVANGIEDIVINLHHRGQQIRDELGNGADMGARLQYSVEKEILGTGGGLKKALPLLDPSGQDEPFISLNGKLIFDFDVQALLKAHAQSEGLGTMVLRHAGNALQWGAVDVVRRGDEKVVNNILGSGEYMFSGVHVTRPSVVARLPEGEACMVRQGYLPWIQGGGKVSAFVHEKGYFAEHSTPKRYLQSNVDLLQEGVLSNPPRGMSGGSGKSGFHSSTRLVEPVVVHPGSQIGANCMIGPNVVIGSGALVADNSTLSNCVVWAGAKVSGAHDGVIVTSQGVLAAQGGDEVDS